MVEMAEGSLFYFKDMPYEPKAAQKFLKPELMPALKELLDQLANLDQLSEEAMAPLLASLAEHYHLKMADIAQALRVALTGKSVSPGIFDVLRLLGKKRAHKRLEAALHWLNERIAGPALTQKT
jgi:glutamyl-tRNA synthetase